MSGETIKRDPDEASPGFFGKIPSHGDFVSRRLSNDFVSVWDRWLSESVSQSRSQLGDQWLDCYLTSPVWRFAISAGLCGEPAWAGVTIPSVDKVGRYYPMTLGAELSAKYGPIEALESLESWYDLAEELALSCLADKFNLEAFDEQLKTLGPPTVGIVGLRPEPLIQRERKYEAKRYWRVGISAAGTPVATNLRLLYHAFHELFELYSLWWTDGSSLVQPSVLVSKALPPTAGYAALLDGAWAKWGWRDKGFRETSDPVVDEVPPLISGDSGGLPEDI